MRIALKWTLILAVALTVWTLALYPFGLNTTETAAGRVATGFTALLPIAAIVMGIREKRRSGAPTATTESRGGLHPVAWMFTILACEAIPIVVVVAAVFVYSMSGGTQAPEQYAQSVALWLGPIAGAVTVGAFAWLVSRTRSGGPQRGFWLGAVVVALDLAIVAAQGASFQMLFAMSGAAKVSAGVLGGLIAARRQDAA
jgi:hypothetical protein